VAQELARGIPTILEPAPKPTDVPIDPTINFSDFLVIYCATKQPDHQNPTQDSDQQRTSETLSIRSRDNH